MSSDEARDPGIHRRALLLGLATLPGLARAQPVWPDRPVTVVNPWPAGGSSDSVARILMQRMAADLGQPFVVENRPGATGTLGHAYVARARPDGATLLVGTNSTYAIAPHLTAALPYDNATALTGVSLLASSPQILCLHPAVPARDLGEFLALARAKPDGFSFGTSGIGGTSHLATEMLMAMSGVAMLHIPYRGGGPAAQALLAGETQVTFIDLITALPFIASGQARPLGASTARRAALAPEVPTIAEAGLPGFESSTDFALMAPAGMPEPIIRKLAGASAAALRAPEVSAKLEAAGITILAEGPEQWPAYFNKEVAKWGDIIKARNIRAP
ncbi:tripartite tricarboxylate transporter substrate binding protein [Belnapia sp. T6]|uniref:Tripartite tricarboxylate transporter substrate binding protein n=1 Tax=Belnapia mucosa TaxID=2804532 RepID=A0ABS1UX86_9PROT|nr:tripartite tricarboxylate transporter substrate binding protein [Belnapia mucosa]MBL6454083.1 tripartite tricarboxylate transporter substrate binding protein [Belnapia mucosa]